MAPLAFVSRSKELERHDAWHPWSTSVHPEGHGVHGTLSLCFNQILIQGDTCKLTREK
jgi:hypothetical protein